MNQTITLPELIKLLSATTNSSENTARQFVTELFSAVSDALAGGKKAKIKGLGTFSAGEFDKSIDFLPDNDLAEAINHPFAFFDAVELDDEITDAELADAEPETIAVTDTTNDIADPVESVENAGKQSDSDRVESIDKQTDDGDKSQSTDEVQKDTNDITGREAYTLQSEPTAEPAPNMIVSGEEDDDPPPLQERRNPSGPNPWLMLAIGLLIGIIVGYLLPSLKEGLSSLWSDGQEKQQLLTGTTGEEKVDTTSVAVKTPPAETVEAEPRQTPSSNEVIADDSKRTDATLTDTIGRNKFLTTMSRKYFGRYEFWVYIYQENADHLGNPDKIAPGTVVTIPPSHKYDINPADPQSLQKAKLKAVEIYAPYQK